MSIMVFAMCMHDEWYVVVVMKLQCSIATISLIEEFMQKFPSLELMNVIGVIYFQYWLNFDVETTFSNHPTLLKA